MGSTAPPGSYEESRRPKRCRDGVRASPRALFAAEKTLRVSQGPVTLCDLLEFCLVGLLPSTAPWETLRGALKGLKASS